MPQVVPVSFSEFERRWTWSTPLKIQIRLGFSTKTNQPSARRQSFGAEPVDASPERQVTLRVQEFGCRFVMVRLLPCLSRGYWPGCRMNSFSFAERLSSRRVVRIKRAIVFMVSLIALLATELQSRDVLSSLAAGLLEKPGAIGF